MTDKTFAEVCKDWNYKLTEYVDKDKILEKECASDLGHYGFCVVGEALGFRDKTKSAVVDLKYGELYNCAICLDYCHLFHRLERPFDPRRASIDSERYYTERDWTKRKTEWHDLVDKYMIHWNEEHSK